MGWQLKLRTLVVKTVDSIDAGAFVIAAQQKEVFGKLDLIGEQQTDGLQRLFASVDVVAQEQVVAFRRKTAVLKQSQQVVILAVNITCQSHIQGGRFNKNPLTNLSIYVALKSATKGNFRSNLSVKEALEYDKLALYTGANWLFKSALANWADQPHGQWRN